MERKNFFGGFEFENESKNFALLHVNILVKKYIWACKNCGSLPNGDSCMRYIKNKINFFFRMSKIFQREWEKSGINIVL